MLDRYVSTEMSSSKIYKFGNLWNLNIIKRTLTPIQGFVKFELGPEGIDHYWQIWSYIKVICLLKITLMRSTHVPSIFSDNFFSIWCLMYCITDNKGFSSLSLDFRCVTPKQENHKNFATVVVTMLCLFRYLVTWTKTQQLWRISLSLSLSTQYSVRKTFISLVICIFGIEIDFHSSSESKSAIFCYFSHRRTLNN